MGINFRLNYVWLLTNMVNNRGTVSECPRTSVPWGNNTSCDMRVFLYASSQLFVPSSTEKHVLWCVWRRSDTQPSRNPFSAVLTRVWCQSVYVVSLGWVAETEKMRPNYSSVEMWWLKSLRSHFQREWRALLKQSDGTSWRSIQYLQITVLWKQCPDYSLRMEICSGFIC